MDEHDDFLAGRLRQAPMNFILKQGDRLFMLGHHGGRAAIAGGGRDRWVGNLGEPPDFFNSAELHVSRAAA